MRQLVVSNADAGVFNNDRRHCVAHCDADSDLAAGIGKLHRVVEENHDQLPNQCRISNYRRFLEFLYFDVDTLLLRYNSRGTRRIDGDVVEENPFALDQSLAGVSARQYQKAVDDTTEPARFRFHSAQRRDVVIRLTRLLQRDFGASTQDGYWCAQLV